MTRTVQDLHGVVHAFESAWWHNTRCGQRVETREVSCVGLWTPVGGRDGAALPEGIVDCVACLSGRSHLGVEDLRNGVEVWAQVRLDGPGGPVGSPQPIMFTRGVNINEVVFDAPIGVAAYGYSYLDEDGRDLHYYVVAFPGGISRKNENDTIMISAGRAQVY